MGAKSTAMLAFFLYLNLLFFATVSGCKTCPKPTPPPCAPSVPPSPPKESCPRDTLKLGVCADVLGLINVTIGSPPVQPCCSLLKGLADLEAAVCLCTAIKANILGINLNIPVSLSLLLNVCSKKTPPGFQCA